MQSGKSGKKRLARRLTWTAAVASFAVAGVIWGFTGGSETLSDVVWTLGQH